MIFLKLLRTIDVLISYDEPMLIKDEVMMNHAIKDEEKTEILKGYYMTIRSTYFRL